MKVRYALGVAALVLVWRVWPVGVAAQPTILNYISDGALPVVQRATSLANFFTSVTTTSRGQLGGLLVEKPSRWAVVSNPAAGTVASASIAAEAATRHVADCVSWSGDASAAVTAAAGTLVLRDGATGAGTIIWAAAVAHQVAAGAGIQTIAPGSVCGLGLVGTTNTAMTAEFNAGVSGEVQAVTLTGFNVQ